MRAIALSLAIAALFLMFGACMASAEEAYGFPLPAGFRLSGGVALNGNKVTVNALSNGTSTVTLNRVTWSQGGDSVVENSRGLKDLAPYGGIGYTKSFGGGFKVNWDAGALFGARPMAAWIALPGLPENLALQNDYIESRSHTVAVDPVAEITFSFKF